MNAPLPQDLPTAPMVPVMTREKFAELVGVTKRTVDGWIDRGYLASIRLGNGDCTTRHSLVNVAVLQRQCLESL